MRMISSFVVLCLDTLNNTLIQLLNFLADWGYWVSPTKVQLSLPRITYLGVLLTPIKDILLLIESPLYPPYHSLHQKQILSFLGLAGYLCPWVPNFSILAQPLYQTTWGDLSEPLQLKSNIRSAFNTLKQAILSAPALTLPDLSPPLCTLRYWETQNCPTSFGTKSGPLFHPCGLSIKAIRYHNSTMASLPTCSGSSCTPHSRKWKTYFWSTHCHLFTTRL